MFECHPSYNRHHDQRNSSWLSEINEDCSHHYLHLISRWDCRRRALRLACTHQRCRAYVQRCPLACTFAGGNDPCSPPSTRERTHGYHRGEILQTTLTWRTKIPRWSVQCLIFLHSNRISKTRSGCYVPGTMAKKSWLSLTVHHQIDWWSTGCMVIFYR